MHDRLYLAASSFYGLYRPSGCGRRVWLRAHGEPEGAPSEFDLLIKELGDRHEKEYLSRFPDYSDLSQGNHADRAQRTRAAISSGAAVIYQGVLRAAYPGTNDLITGIPDFLLKEGESCRIVDCKLSRSADEKKHPELPLQLQIYGWLYEQQFGRPPAALEIYLGDRSTETVPYGGATDALAALERIRALSLVGEEPYEPVGWAKCEACPFGERCWKIAEAARDVSLVVGLDQASTYALREQGTRTYDELVERFTEQSLSQLKRKRGEGTARVGKPAGRILAQARALVTGKEERIGDPELPPARVLAMLDLEGVPPQYEDLEKVYLWGVQLFSLGQSGLKPSPVSPYAPALAGFGEEGDREGWESFLSACRQMLKDHGEIPFVHWSAYETTKIRSYAARFGDADGTAQRVLGCCFDLLTAVRKALVLPVYSYGLKTIEGVAGFSRSQEEFGGSWSIARYIRAAESRDEGLRASIMSEILRYNEEDLKAMWAVYLWVKGKE